MNTDQMFDVPVQDAAWGHATASDADGLELHYVRWGQGTPRVLLLHGWPGFWYDWRRVLPRLAQFPSHIRRRFFGARLILLRHQHGQIDLATPFPTCLGYSS